MMIALKNIKFLLILLSIFLLMGNEVFAVGGISNTKVIVPSTETVPKNRFEFEPFFGFVFVDDSIDTKEFEAGARFTLGVLDNLELGANISFLTIEDDDLNSSDYNFGDIASGLKYRVVEEKSFSLAYQGGVTFPTSSSDSDWVFEPAGLILTKNFTERFSLDADSVLSIEEDDVWGVTNELGLGYFINESLQPVVELAYIYENVDDDKNSHIVNITGGFTAGVSDFLTIILGVTKDIVSENIDDSLTFTAAVTFLF